MFARTFSGVPRTIHIARKQNSPSWTQNATVVHQRLLSSSRKVMKLVSTRIDDQGVALVTFENPDKLNAMTEEMGSDFQTAIESLKKKPRGEVRAVVITGAGRAFSAGVNLFDRADTVQREACSTASVIACTCDRLLVTVGAVDLSCLKHDTWQVRVCL
eukprot:m.238336 g.238336  ORF g.238336 m.238336 type:complete len:159 (+) comp19388_c0_seq7:108-584(+)